MAENNFDAKPVKAKLKPGILPGVREIKRPDFFRRAEDIEKAEESRMQSLALEAGAEAGSDVLNDAQAAESFSDAEEAAAVAASLAAQEGASDEEQLDESSITDEPKWYVAHT